MNSSFFQRLPSNFEKKTVLGIHEFCVSRIDPEKIIIKLISILNNSSSRNVIGSSFDSLRYTFIQFIRTKSGNGIYFIDQVFPECVYITCPGEPASHSNNSNGPV